MLASTSGNQLPSLSNCVKSDNSVHTSHNDSSVMSALGSGRYSRWRKTICDEPINREDTRFIKADIRLLLTSYFSSCANFQYLIARLANWEPAICQLLLLHLQITIASAAKMRDSEISSTSEEGNRLKCLLSLCPRYVVVPSNPPDGIAFALTGNSQEWDHLTDLHSGISNCKPGVWKAETKMIEGAEFGNCDTEACLRWVADLDEENELDFSISLDEWQAWDQMFKDRFDDSAAGWDEGLAWKHAGTYYDDGGLFNVISMAYLTREAAAMVMEGRGAGEEDIDEDEWNYYLETITLNDNLDGEDCERNSGFTFGGLHFGQDSIGGPPGLSVAEKDGQVVAIKLFMDDDELDEGTPFDSQPGKVVF